MQHNPNYQDPQKLITLSEVSKRFGSTAVLKDVNFTLLSGEVHALVGENGAGKSTCLGLLYGLHQPNEGSIKLGDDLISIENPAHAQSLGIGCVFQELSLASSLSVAENIFVGRAPTHLGFVDWAKLKHQAETLLAEFDITIDVTQSVSSFPISTRQMIEIVKALSLNSKILLLDEPTSALTPDEVDGLFKVIKKLTQKGIGIVYVSHHMSEIFTIADRITVLRDGSHISTNPTKNTSEKQVVREMVGAGNFNQSINSQSQIGDVILGVSDLSHNKHHDKHYENISFSLRKGEILGFAGLLGSRRSEIVRAIIGLDNECIGKVTLKGKECKFASLRDAIDAGIGFVPEERKTEGLFLEFSSDLNLVSASLEKNTALGVLNKSSIHEACIKAIDAFNIKTNGPKQPVGDLSGGNQQKLMLAKWLERNPDVLIIEEPTKGVDIGAKFQIHKELQRRAAEGMAIIIVSSDFPELMSLSDRILVIYEGKINGNIVAKDLDEDNLYQMAAGLTEKSIMSNTQKGNDYDHAN